MHASLQRKFSFSYIAIILAVLILLNTYPLITSENLTFRSKQSSLQGSVSVMVTALSGLEELSEENVAGAMTLVEETGISRVLVTDASGRVLYDTRETDGAIGRYAFYTELVQALRGEDVFYTEFSDKAFKSRAASPVIYHSQTIGAVYAYEYDTEQAELLLSLQRNLLTISAVVLVFAGGISVLLSRVLTRRFGVLTDAIRKMREGSYSHRAEVGGHDEISELAAEFNDMADRLQTTEDARRRFVSDASHELKTPLAGIRLLSDSILQTENMDAQTVREFVGDIEQESERLARITENLLRLTRLDSGMLPEAQRVDLSSVMARVVRMLRLVAEEKQVDLSYEIRREGQTLASEDEIHEIIYNLTENAIKYNRPGGFVKLLLAGDEKDCLLTVSDNGIGIPEGDMPRIFDRFYRVDKMRSRAAGGTGLGLSIAADTARRRGRAAARCLPCACRAAKREGMRHEKTSFPDCGISPPAFASLRLRGPARAGDGRKRLRALFSQRSQLRGRRRRHPHAGKASDARRRDGDRRLCPRADGGAARRARRAVALVAHPGGNGAQVAQGVGPPRADRLERTVCAPDGHRPVAR